MRGIGQGLDRTADLPLFRAALRMGRAAFFEIDGKPFGEQLGYLSGKLAELAATEDAQEGITAFLEKRPPRFTGR